jgi:leucyl aminopeptidase
MKFQINTSSTSESENLVIPIIQNDELQTTLNSLAQRFELPENQLNSDFKADLKEIQFFYQANRKIYLLGLGKTPQSKDWIRAFRYFFHQNKTKISANLAIEFYQFEIENLEYVVNGSLLGTYDIKLYKTDKKETANSSEPTVEILIDKEKAEVADNQIFKGKCIAETQMEIMHLVNAPSNKKNPQTLAAWAIQSGQKYGFEVRLLDKESLEKEGLHALLAVSQGSANPPYLIILEYKPFKAHKKIGLVGKGVTFDTGGVSLKGSTNMHYMKSDMGGAAAVLGTMEVAAKLQLPFHLIGIIPTTENFIDNQSIKPGDVINSYLGKTIEVIDTDAEGRLILADGLAYIHRNYHPEILIDLATLTGSCVQALGYMAGGLFTNQDSLAEKLLQAGEKSGEKLWRLPMWDDYKDDISSDIADLRNYSGKPVAGAISAAKFLEAFTENHPNFAHLDIAGVAFGDSEFAAMKSATAYGIRLLLTFLELID